MQNQQNKINIQKLLGRLQAQIGAHVVRINILELEIERLNGMIPQPPTVAKKEQ